MYLYNVAVYFIVLPPLCPFSSCLVIIACPTPTSFVLPSSDTGLRTTRPVLTHPVHTPVAKTHAFGIRQFNDIHLEPGAHSGASQEFANGDVSFVRSRLRTLVLTRLSDVNSNHTVTSGSVLCRAWPAHAVMKHCLTRVRPHAWGPCVVWLGRIIRWSD